MKKIYKTISIALLSVMMLTQSGCSGFLDPKLPSDVLEDFYDTKKGQEKLLIDIFSRYRKIYNTGEIQYFGTDLYMAITESQSEKMFNGYDKSFNSTAPVVKDYWKGLYKVVQESNILLNRCTEETAGKDYDLLTSQARFLRVLAYYYLVETFGPVPFYTEESKGVITETTRTDEATIYQFMIDELEATEGKLGMKNNEYGTVNNAAVLHLLGKLYLTRANRSYASATDFGKAAEKFELIIGSVNYALLDNYADVYSESNQHNSEVIWAIQYGTDKNYVGDGNDQHKLFGFSVVALESEMFIRSQSDYSSMSRQYWVIPSVHELFVDPEIDTRYDATFQRKFYVNNKDHAKYGELGLHFPRWNDNSGITEGAVKYFPFKVDGQYNWYPQSTALPVMEKGLDRMPIVQKFKDSKIEWGAGGSREDVIFRLSDAYLLAAEAYLGAGNSSLALERINTIRKRAAKDNNAYEQSMKLTAIDINIVLDERARELLGEHDRWFDLKRTNTLLARAMKFNPLVAKYNNLNKNHLIRPIPQDEINKVKGLDQNEGY